MTSTRAPPKTILKTSLRTDSFVSTPDGWRGGLFPPLTAGGISRAIWLAAAFAVAAPAPATAQTGSQALPPQYSQQGGKLVGSLAVGPAEQGWSVALSADGNIAIVGGLVDSKLNGAAWIYARDHDAWSQQGHKLVGSGVVGQSGQGISVALSADGKTAMVGGPYDNRTTGAVWLYTHVDGAWTQVGGKLVGTGAIGRSAQGSAVALSADGSTAIVGGPYDNGSAGAAWIYVRSSDAWTQQGNKLFGSGAVGSARQGVAVALSADGNTAIVGGAADDNLTGAAWVYTRTGGAWSQQGAKLVGTGAIGNAAQGVSVALSADGNTAMVGGVGDNKDAGAAWIYTRTNGVWAQQGGKLVGSGAIGSAAQGHSVALSADGNTAFMSGPHDNGGTGAAWIYARSGTRWTQQGNKLVGTGAAGSARQGASVALSADGNTAIMGGIADDRLTGAAWVHVRRGSAWSEPAAQLGF